MGTIGASRVELRVNPFAKSSALAWEFDRISSTEINGRKDASPKFELILLANGQNVLIP